MNRREALVHTAATIALSSSVGALALTLTRKLNEKHEDRLKTEDFENATWLPYTNKSGRIWSCYTYENIPQNQDNWTLYQEEVSKKNNGNLDGYILLPDLDKSGEVGK